MRKYSKVYNAARGEGQNKTIPGAAGPGDGRSHYTALVHSVTRKPGIIQMS